MIITFLDFYYSFLFPSFEVHSVDNTTSSELPIAHAWLVCQHFISRIIRLKKLRRDIVETKNHTRQLSVLVVEGPGFEPWVSRPRIFKIVFHQQRLGSLSIPWGVKLESALYSVFYPEAGKRPWTSLNEWIGCVPDSKPFTVWSSSIHLPLTISWLSFDE